MQIKIYLNGSKENRFQRFDENVSELTMVYSFEISETHLGGNIPDMAKFLAWVYVALNMDPEDLTDASKVVADEYRKRSLRSLSVGDVVAIGEGAWAVDPIGWTKITSQQLNRAIIWNDETEAVI